MFSKYFLLNNKVFFSDVEVLFNSIGDLGQEKKVNLSCQI